MVFIIGLMGRLTPIQLGKEEIFMRNQFVQDVLITRCIIGFIDSILLHYTAFLTETIDVESVWCRT